LDNNGVALVLLLAIVLGGFGLVAFSLRGRQRLRELMIRERIAMIEKGLVPSPEQDPLRFEQSLGNRPDLGAHLHDVAYQRVGSRLSGRGSLKGSRYRSAGVLLIGLGVAFFMVIAFTAGLVEVGFGIGGSFVVLGIAVFINGVLLSHEPSAPPDPGASRPASTPSAPPPNVGP
jgi:hypothetical protein